MLQNWEEHVNPWGEVGILDISLGGEVLCGPSYPDPTLFKTNIADFPTLFKAEFQFLIPCVRHLSCLRQKLINSIPCLRQKSQKTYPGWLHIPIKSL